MKTKFSGILTLLLAFVVQFTFAQEKTISGTVTDESGLPLPGATVVVKGTSKGASTDFDGKYTISADVGQVLEFSYVGYSNQSITINNQTTIDVSLALDNTLEEVVVTAFGIEREAKSLAYSTETIKSEELVQAAPVNAVTSLQGKASGLNIITRNNGVNPSTAIILRGYNSITSSNAALIVIDGVIQASTALNDLNPNDIATSTILKGASATALYGSDGANGAIIIETKKGSRDTGLQVGINSSVTFETVKYFPETQTKFGPGLDLFTYDPLENTQWGPRYDGVVRRVGPILPDGSFQELPYAPINDNRVDFFNTGVTLINGFDVSGGDENSTIFFSARRADVEGITPKDEYRKDNFRLNASRKVGKLGISTNISFFEDRTDVVAPDAGYQTRGVYWNVINTPSNIPLTSYKNWRTERYSTKETYFNEYYQNPYMIIDIGRDRSRSNRLQANVKFDYEFNDWITAAYSLTGTYFNQHNKNIKEAVTYNPAISPSRTGSNTPASVLEQHTNNRRVNSDFRVMFNRDLTDDFNLSLILGNNVQTFRQSDVFVFGDNLIVPDLYDVSVRTGELQGGNSTTQSTKVGYYADLTLGYKDFAYLNGAYRYDTSSTLPLDNNGYSFYTFGGSVLLTEAIPALKSDAFNYFKVRASYAQVGNDPTIGYINELFTSAAGFPFGSISGFSTPTLGADADFSPEIQTTWEAGAELYFLKNRITLSATYFNTKTEDQFLSAGTSTASGIQTFRTNSGVIENKGIELDLGLTPIKNENFRWTLNLKLSKIDNEVISLADGADRVQVGLANAEVGVFAQVGESYPQVFGTAYTRDDQGRVVINPATGDPVVSSELKNLGSATPDLILGGSTNLSYKNFTLSATADYKTGHVYYNTLVDALEFTGSTLHSATSDRQPFVFPNSSYPNGSGGFTPNTNILTSGGGFSFWNNTYNAIKENYVTDATTLKLREVALSYNIPAKYLENTFIKSLNFGLVARNLIMLRSAQNVYTDPEFTTDTQEVAGLGTTAQLPPTANYGFKVDIKF